MWAQVAAGLPLKLLFNGWVGRDDAGERHWNSGSASL